MGRSRRTQPGMLRPAWSGGLAIDVAFGGDRFARRLQWLRGQPREVHQQLVGQQPGPELGRWPLTAGVTPPGWPAGKWQVDVQGCGLG